MIMFIFSLPPAPSRSAMTQRLLRRTSHCRCLSARRGLCRRSRSHLDAPRKHWERSAASHDDQIVHRAAIISMRVRMAKVDQRLSAIAPPESSGAITSITAPRLMRIQFVGRRLVLPVEQRSSAPPRS
jgi:hypothetical protein